MNVFSKNIFEKTTNNSHQPCPRKNPSPKIKKYQKTFKTQRQNTKNTIEDNKIKNFEKKRNRVPNFKSQ